MSNYDASCRPCINAVLDEADVGISNFVVEVGRDVGLGGKIKTEMEDFEVLEVSLQQSDENKRGMTDSH